jgi:hypothetical protein
MSRFLDANSALTAFALLVVLFYSAIAANAFGLATRIAVRFDLASDPDAARRFTIPQWAVRVVALLGVIIGFVMLVLIWT